MLLSFEETVSALCYSIIRERCGPPGPEAEFPNNRVVRFVLEQHGRMPDFLRFGLRELTVLFDLCGLLRRGRPFHRWDHEQRLKQIAAWRSSSLGFRRDLIKFYESLVVFCWYSIAHE